MYDDDHVIILQSLKREKKSVTNKLTGIYLLLFTHIRIVFINTEAKNIIVELESQCTGLHKANRKLKEQLDRLQEDMELSRDRENFVHNELSKAILKVPHHHPSDSTVTYLLTV